MLRRDKPPNQGLWNGVGGHIEPGELPRASVLREVREETGLRLTAVRFAGLLTWEGFEIESGGLYLFTARACPKTEPPDCNEGQLAWKPLDWVLSASEVVSNIHPVLARQSLTTHVERSIILFISKATLYNICPLLYGRVWLWDNL